MHRVIAEQMLGRPLDAHEHVHHIDGNKHNNDPKNLAVLTRVEHIKIHRKEIWAGQKLKRKLSSEQVEEIRKSKLCHREIALIYGVSLTLVGQIKRRKIYFDIK